MADHDHEAESGHDDHEHHGGVRKYVMVFIALCILTAISFAVGNSALMTPKYITIGWALMMLVSCAKAMLVISFFMHLIWEANWKYVLTIPASIMSIFLVLMLVPDIGERTEHYSEERAIHSSIPADEPTADEVEEAEDAHIHKEDEQPK